MEKLAIRIRAIATELPDWRVDNDTVAEWCGLEPDTVLNKIGIAERRFLTHDQTTSDLAVRSVNKLLGNNAELAREAVDLLVVVTQNPDHKLPHTAAAVQEKAGLAVSTATFDLNLGCSGWVYALSAVKGMMLAEDFANAVIVTCDPYSKVMDRANRDVVGLFGDGAAATWLSRDRGGEIGKGDYGTDGSGGEHLIVKAGGAALPKRHLDGGEVAQTEERDEFLHMNGRAIFNFMITRVPDTIERCLDRNGIARDDVDLFIFHQANAYMLQALVKRLGLAPEKVPIDMEKTGNTVSSTIPMVLGNLMARGETEGRNVLVCGFGVGLSWATNVINFGE